MAFQSDWAQVQLLSDRLGGLVVWWFGGSVVWWFGGLVAKERFPIYPTRTGGSNPQTNRRLGVTMVVGKHFSLLLIVV